MHSYIVDRMINVFMKLLYFPLKSPVDVDDDVTMHSVCSPLLPHGLCRATVVQYCVDGCKLSTTCDPLDAILSIAFHSSVLLSNEQLLVIFIDTRSIGIKCWCSLKGSRLHVTSTAELLTSNNCTLDSIGSIGKYHYNR